MSQPIQYNRECPSNEEGSKRLQSHFIETDKNNLCGAFFFSQGKEIFVHIIIHAEHTYLHCHELDLIFLKRDFNGPDH